MRSASEDGPGDRRRDSTDGNVVVAGTDASLSRARERDRYRGHRRYRGRHPSDVASRVSGGARVTLEELKAAWLAKWPDAIKAWSPYIKLSEPTWCYSESDEKREGLTGSFAMIRLVDHRVVISLRQIAED